MPLDLAAIAARLEAVTPGEWWYDGYSRVYVGLGDFATVVASVPVVAGDTATRSGERDADLIAHAPADLAALLAEVERLRAVVEAARAFDAVLSDDCDCFERHELRHALAALDGGGR